MTPRETATELVQRWAGVEFCQGAEPDQNALDILTGYVADAISAERERCAKIADAHITVPLKGSAWFVTEAQRGRDRCAEQIAAAIRSGKP